MQGLPLGIKLPVLRAVWVSGVLQHAQGNFDASRTCQSSRYFVFSNTMQALVVSSGCFSPSAFSSTVSKETASFRTCLGKTDNRRVRASIQVQGGVPA